jgi:hypothetical protein
VLVHVLVLVLEMPSVKTRRQGSSSERLAIGKPVTWMIRSSKYYLKLWNALYSLRQKSSTSTSRSTSTNGQPVSQQPRASRASLRRAGSLISIDNYPVNGIGRFVDRR